ncbi:hypothetical protein IPdc08_01587 [archaeon]|nr:hypothetical protein IPdc08_01587 [archaeon]
MEILIGSIKREIVDSKGRGKMLFLVVSSPRSSDLTEDLIKARLWLRECIHGLKEVVCFYPREGRGSVVIFNVSSKRDLDRLLEEWQGFVSVKFKVYPLQDPEAAERSLRDMLKK